VTDGGKATFSTFETTIGTKPFGKKTKNFWNKTFSTNQKVYSASKDSKVTVKTFMMCYKRFYLK